MKMWLGLVLLMSFKAYAASPEQIRERAVPFRAHEIPAALEKAVGRTKIFLVGEVHGTNEMPEFMHDLVAHLSGKRKVAVGLEFPRSTQDLVRLFMASGDEAVLRSHKFFTHSVLHSGRGSLAMIALLHRLRELQVEVFCFDVEPDFRGDERDTLMAKNILSFEKQNPARQLLIYSGNRHSRVSNGYPGSPRAKNMGAELVRLARDRKKVDSLMIRFAEGSLWGCRAEEDGRKSVCGMQSIGPVPTAYATAVGYDLYYLEEPSLTDGHSYVAFIRRTSGSLPF